MAVRSILKLVIEDETEGVRHGLAATGKATEMLGASTRSLAHDQLELRGAQLKVEETQVRVNKATARYGVDSLAARKAQLQLEQAQSRVNVQGERQHRSFLGLTSSAGKLVGGLAGVAAGFTAIEFARGAIDTTEDIGEATLKLHRNFGLTIASASQWAGIARARNIDNTKLAQSFGILSKQIAVGVGSNEKQALAEKNLATIRKQLTTEQRQALDVAVRTKAGSAAQIAALQTLTQAHNGLNKVQTETIQTSVGLVNGATSQSKALRQLGLSQDDIVRGQHDFDFLLGKVADGFQHLPGGVDKTALAMKLFGRQWQTIMPLLRGGSKGLEEQKAVAEKYGITLSGKTAEQVHKLVAAQREWKLATTGLQLELGEHLIPAMTGVIHGGNELALMLHGPLSDAYNFADREATTFIHGIQTGTGAGGDFANAMTTAWAAVSRGGQFLGPIALDVGKLGLGFLGSKEGAVALDVALGGLAGRFAVLGIEGAIAKVASFAQWLKQARAANLALSGTIAKSPWGLAAIGIGAVVGGLLALTGHEHQAKVSAEDFNEALAQQKQLLQQLHDLPLDTKARRLRVDEAKQSVKDDRKALDAAKQTGDLNQIAHATLNLRGAKLELAQAEKALQAAPTDHRVEAARINAGIVEKTGTKQRIRDTMGEIEQLQKRRAEFLLGAKVAKDMGISTAASYRAVAAVTAQLTAKTAELNRQLAGVPREIQIKIGLVSPNFGGVGDTLKDLGKALENIGKRRGGLVNRFGGGGMVPAFVSPGEEIHYGGSAFTVPGARTASDSVLMSLPVGAAVITDDGQRRMAGGASIAEALSMQAPHFAGGGVVTGRVSTFGPPGERAGTTASGVSSSEPGIAVRPGATFQTGRPFLGRWFDVRIGHHVATLKDIDLGPHQSTGRRIDVTGAGARKLGLDPLRFPTDAIGTATPVGSKGTENTSSRLKLGSRYLDSARTAGFDAAASGAHRVSGDLLSEIIAGSIGALSRSTGDTVGARGSGKVKRMIDAADRIAARNYPYVYGGGHGKLGVASAPGGGPRGFDCSGYVSAILGAAGLATGVMTTDQLKTFGLGGAGRLMAIAVRGSTGRNAHTMMALRGSPTKPWRFYESGSGHGPAKVTGWSGSFPIRRHASGYRTGGVAGFMDPHSPNFLGWGYAGGGTISRSGLGGVHFDANPAASLASLLSAVLRPAGTESRAVTAAFDQLSRRLADTERVSFAHLATVIAHAVKDASAARKAGDKVGARRYDSIANLARAEQGIRLEMPITRLAATQHRIDVRQQLTDDTLRYKGINPTSTLGLATELGVGTASYGALAGKLPGLQKDLARAKKLKNSKAVEAIGRAIEDLDLNLADRAAALADLQRQLRYSPFEDRISSATAAFVQAQVDTPTDTTDDRSALTSELSAAVDAYNTARASGDNENIVKYGQEVVSLRQSIDGLDQTMKDQQNAVTQALTDALSEYNANQKKLLALLASQPDQLVAALTAAVNGDLGGRVGLAGMTPLFPGQGVRY